MKQPLRKYLCQCHRTVINNYIIIIKGSLITHISHRVNQGDVQ